MATHNTKVENTKNYLQAALIELIETMPLTKVTVSALTKKAGISRGTFYLHYLDINDYISSLEADIFSVIQTNLSVDLLDDDKFDKLELLITYVQDHFTIFRALIGQNGDKNFEKQLIDLVREFIVSHTERRADQEDLPEVYVVDWLTMSIVSIIYTWLAEENPRSSQEIIAILLRTRYLSPADLIGKKA